MNSRYIILSDFRNYFMSPIGEYYFRIETLYTIKIRLFDDHLWEELIKISVCLINDNNFNISYTESLWNNSELLFKNAHEGLNGGWSGRSFQMKCFRYLICKVWYGDVSGVMVCIKSVLLGIGFSLCYAIGHERVIQVSILGQINNEYFYVLLCVCFGFGIIFMIKDCYFKDKGL
jgi:hypothetical protein